MKRTSFAFSLLVLFLDFAAVLYAQELPPKRTISIRECIEIALRTNIDIAVSYAEKEIVELGVPIEEAAFLPKFTWDLTAAQNIAPTNSAIDNRVTVDQRYLQSNFGVSEKLPFGSTMSLAFENLRQETNSAEALLSPEYVTGLKFSIEQPLLKNRGSDVAERSGPN